MKAFSTITSSRFSELVILVGATALTSIPPDRGLFDTLRSMNRVKPFRLIFLLLSPDLLLREARRNLEGVLNKVAARGLLDFLDSPPVIRSAQPPEPRWYY
jgi:hypothetical protein